MLHEPHSFLTFFLCHKHQLGKLMRRDREAGASANKYEKEASKRDM